jgi:branched-subunit amino acid aminotransferase/4-amino-4-deoxychorismate lyase
LIAMNELFDGYLVRAFMATTAGGIMPITELDGQPVGGGQVGPVTRKVWEAYWDAHYSDTYSFAVEYA